MKSKLLILLFASLVLVNLSCKKKINPALNKPLLLAIRAGDLSKVKELVSSGADVNGDVNGFRPLVEAANKKHNEIVKYLVKEDADVNLQDKDGDTALIVAALRGSLDAVTLLIEQGAKIDVQNKKGKTALIYAIYAKHSDIVKHLLDKGADPILRDKNGNDPLSLAITVKKKDIIEALLGNGAAVTMTHLKLAHKLYCRIDIEHPSSADYNDFPYISKLLETPYLIKKDINYHHHSKLTKTVVSYDKKRKAEVYNNGVIKIYDLKSGKFIKAIGSVQFIKDVKYPVSNRLIIEKKINLKVSLIKAYIGLKTGKWIAMGRIDAFFLTRNVIMVFDVNKTAYDNYKNEYFSHYKYGISNTGKYFYTIYYSSTSISGFSELILFASDSGNRMFTLRNPGLHQGDTFWKKLNTYPYPLIDFSFDDKYMLVKFYGQKNLETQLNTTAALVLDIKKRKFVLKKIFKTDIEKIKFAKNQNALIVDYAGGRKHLIGLE